jgi:hypothetical protein
MGYGPMQAGKSGRRLALCADCLKRAPFLTSALPRGHASSRFHPGNTKIVTSVSDFVNSFPILVMAGLDPAIHENLKPCDQQTDKIIELQQASK